MLRAWRAFWDDFAAELELRAAELRSGVTLIEAVAADRFEIELRAAAGGDAAELREIALDAAKVGLSRDEACKAFQQWVGYGPIRREET